MFKKENHKGRLETRNVNKCCIFSHPESSKFQMHAMLI